MNTPDQANTQRRCRRNRAKLHEQVSSYKFHVNSVAAFGDHLSHQLPDTRLIKVQLSTPVPDVAHCRLSGSVAFAGAA